MPFSVIIETGFDSAADRGKRDGLDAISMAFPPFATFLEVFVICHLFDMFTTLTRKRKQAVHFDVLINALTFFITNHCFLHFATFIMHYL